MVKKMKMRRMMVQVIISIHVEITYHEKDDEPVTLLE